MLYWAAVFLIIAILAAAIGLGGVASVATLIAKVCAVVFLVLFLVSLLMGWPRKPMAS